MLALPLAWGRLDFLASLLKHSAVLLASAGTICLDAIALDNAHRGPGL